MAIISEKINRTCMARPPWMNQLSIFYLRNPVPGSWVEQPVSGFSNSPPQRI
jgi:hypothetical protein